MIVLATQKQSNDLSIPHDRVSHQFVDVTFEITSSSFNEFVVESTRVLFGG